MSARTTKESFWARVNKDGLASEAQMKFGVYRKIKVSGRGKGTGVGELYQFIGISRNHYTGAQSVIYIPLRVMPEWAGTVRMCDIPREDFEAQFEFVGEGLP